MNPETKTALEHIAYVMLRSAHSRFRQHARDIRAAFLIYGDHGPVVSGCVRSHFPEAIKDTLRKRFRTAHEDLEISLAYWKLAGRRTRTWHIVADKALNH